MTLPNRHSPTLERWLYTAYDNSLLQYCLRVSYAVYQIGFEDAIQTAMFDRVLTFRPPLMVLRKHFISTNFTPGKFVWPDGRSWVTYRTLKQALKGNPEGIARSNFATAFSQHTGRIRRGPTFQVGAFFLRGNFLFGNINRYTGPGPHTSAGPPCSARAVARLPRDKSLVRASLLTQPFLRKLFYYLLLKSLVSLKRSLSRPSAKYSLCHGQIFFF